MAFTPQPKRMKFYKLLGVLMIIIAIVILVWGDPQGTKADNALIMGGAVILAIAGIFIVQTQRTHIPWVIIICLFFASCGSNTKQFRAKEIWISQTTFRTVEGYTMHIIEAKHGFLPGDTVTSYGSTYVLISEVK